MLSLAQRASSAQSVPNGQTISRIGSILRLAYEVKVFFKSVLVFQCILKSITRLTVGRVKPFLDLHRLCAHDAIMIPYKAWTLYTSSSLLLPYFLDCLSHCPPSLFFSLIGQGTIFGTWLLSF